MRKITKIILHCSDSDRENTAADVDRWHKERGWDGIGYHYFVRKSGVIESGRPLEVVGAHCKGHNKDSVGICLDGRNRFNVAQFKSLKALLDSLQSTCPSAKVYGHNEFDKNKTCPVYSVTRFKDYYENPQKENLLWRFLTQFLK